MRAFLLAIMLLSMRLSAQSSLGMSQQVLNFPDSTTFGDSATFTGWVKNFGPVSYTGTINIMIGVRDTSGTQLNKTDSVFTTLLAVNDSIQFTFKEVFTQANYRAGTNVVVIWPQPASGGAPHDTLTRNLYITPSMITEEKPFTFGLFPNPATGDIVIVSEVTGAVQIFDGSGRLVARYTNEKQLDVSLLVPGLYILELTSPDHRSSRKRFLKL